MQMDFNKNMKFVSVWLTKEDSVNPQVEEELKKLKTMCKEKKYKCVVCHSGNRDLVELTGALLEHNKSLGFSS